MMKVFATTIVVAFLGLTDSFTTIAPSTKCLRTRLQMGGGRSPAEKNLSKRQMFLQLKEKLKVAAQAPGFFQVGEGAPVSRIC